MKRKWRLVREGEEAVSVRVSLVEEHIGRLRWALDGGGGDVSLLRSELRQISEGVAGTARYQWSCGEKVERRYRRRWVEFERVARELGRLDCVLAIMRLALPAPAEVDVLAPESIVRQACILASLGER